MIGEKTDKFYTTIPTNTIRTEIWFTITTFWMIRVCKPLTNTNMNMMNMVTRQKVFTNTRMNGIVWLTMQGEINYKSKKDCNNQSQSFVIMEIIMILNWLLMPQ